jgi:hypothetical protein
MPNHTYLNVIKHTCKAKYAASPTASLQAALDAVGFVPIEVAVALGLDVGLEGVVLCSLTTTYISPVASEETNILPWLSKAIPTGLKQLLGQTELSAFAKMSVVAVVLFVGSTGSPLANAMRDTLYPIGTVRSLITVSDQNPRTMAK